MLAYKLAEHDLIAFNVHYQKTSLGFFQRHWRWLIFVIFAAYVFKSSPSIVEGLLDWANWLIIVFMAFFFLLMIKFRGVMQTKTIRAFIKNNPESIGERSIIFDQQRLTLTSSKSSTNYSYSAFIKIQESQHHYYLFYGRESAIIIPKADSYKRELSQLIETISIATKI